LQKSAFFVEICYKNFWPTCKNFQQPKNFRLLQQLGGATACYSTPKHPQQYAYV